MYRTSQSNFSKGEIAPQLYGRFDVDSYSAGVRLARNMVIVKYGGLSKRVGTRLVMELDDGSESYRLVPFTFNLEQAYALVLGQYTLNVAALGGMILDEELEIVAATNTNPIQLIVPFHEYSVGEKIFCRNVEGMVEINGRFIEILSVIDDSNITIDADGTTMGVFTGSGGGTLRAAPPAPPPPPPTPSPTPTPTPPPIIGGGGWDGNPGTSIP